MTEITIAATQAPISVINDQVIIFAGGQGLPGARGLSGGTENAVAGQTISALKIVYNDPATGKILYADKDSALTANSLLGVAIQSGLIDDILLVRTFGEMEDGSWNWNMTGNVNLFLGANGAIVQGVLSGAVVVRIGYAISSTKIMIRIGDFIVT